LRAGLITAPVALLEIREMKVPQVFLQSMPNQRGPIHFLSLRREIGGLQELRIQNHLYGFRCGLHSTVYPTPARRRQFLYFLYPL